MGRQRALWRAPSKRWVVYGCWVLVMGACSSNGEVAGDAGDGASPDGASEGGVDGGGDGGEDAAPPDGSADAARDAEADADADADAGDGGDADADAGDGSPDLCGNGDVDPGESCDGDALDGQSCEGLGLPAGQLACHDDCAFDTSGCAQCGDGICSDAEGSAGCATDCGVVSIAAGRFHTCAALGDGTLWCWGARRGHRMGGATDTRTPIRVAGASDVVQVAAGEGHTCYVTGAEEIHCFGRNGFGEAGVASLKVEVFPPRKVMDGTQVAVGAHHSCGIGSDTGVSCWGRGDYGNRGDGTYGTRNGAPQSALASGGAKLALGSQFSCAEGAGGGVACWGENDQGQLGVGDRIWRSEPTSVVGNYSVGVGAGHRHMCVTLMNPTAPPSFSGLYCQGSNTYGQLGAAASADYTSAQKVGQGARFVVGGFGYTCVLPDVGLSPSCWGDNYFGQLGDGTTESRHARMEVPGLTAVDALSGGYNHVCALLPDATVRCWGDNREGQLGLGEDVRWSASPVSPPRFGASLEGGT